MLVYNVFVPVPLDQPFKPMSDGRSPFTKDQWQAAGFTVEAFDEDDTPAILRVLAAPRETDGCATSPRGDESPPSDLHALYTLVRRGD